MNPSAWTRRGTATWIAMPAIALLILLACPSAGFGWSAPRLLNEGDAKILSVSGGVGKRGYAVMAWSQVRDDLPFVSKNVRAFVRVKGEGARGFGRVRSLGRATGGPGVEVGSNGHTLVTWTRPGNKQMVMMRSPRGRWSKPQVLGGNERRGVLGEIGPDGTMLLVSTNVRGSRDPKANIKVALKLPRESRFGPWRKASRSGLTVGLHTDLVVGNKGHATVLWSGPCPLGGPAENARWVDITRKRVSAPKQIQDSKCVAFDLDLERDRAGYQYLRIGGTEKPWIGIKFAVRSPGADFPPMELISPEGQLTNGGDMAVSPDGDVFLVWDSHDEEQAPLAREFVTYKQDQRLAGPALIAGARVDKSGRFDRVRAMGFLPDGTLSTIWWEQWLVSGGRERFKIQPKTINPISPRINHRYGIPIKPNLYPTNVDMDVASDGSQMIWWTVADGHDRSIRWIQARER